jgi:hypothetical protein
MPQSNQGGSNHNSSTSKPSGDKQRTQHSEKGKAGQGSHGAQVQKAKEEMKKGKMNNERDDADRNRSGSDDDE